MEVANRELTKAINQFNILNTIRKAGLISRVEIAELTGQSRAAVTNITARLIKEKMIIEKIIPEKAARDALHIAVATFHEMFFLLSWNCKHIANAEIIRQLRKTASDEGFELPVICTPEELLERS